MTIIIKDNVQTELFTTNTETLTAVTINFNVNEFSHLIIETKNSCSVTTANIRPSTTIVNKVLEWRYPGVNGALDSVVQSSKLRCDKVHLYKILSV